VEIEKVDDYRFKMSQSCEGDADVCALIQRLKEHIARLVVEEMRFAEKLRDRKPYRAL